MRHVTVVISLVALLSGCANAEKAPAPLEPGLVQYVLDEVPSDVQHRMLIDFSAKVHLVGYDLEPAGEVKPGSRFKLRMYWKSISRLSPGWSLFTHLVAPDGRRLERGGLDDVGPLRTRTSPTGSQALSPSDWVPGKVYVDEQEIELPANVRAPEVNVMVGVWRPNNLRLSVIGGPSDKEERGIVTTVKTGVDWPTPEQAKALAQADQVAAAGGGSAMPRMQRPPMRVPNLRPGQPMQPGMQPGAQPGMPPGAQPGAQPGMQPGMQPARPVQPPTPPNQGQNR
jgi:hypothetical protein